MSNETIIWSNLKTQNCRALIGAQAGFLFPSLRIHSKLTFTMGDHMATTLDLKWALSGYKLFNNTADRQQAGLFVLKAQKKGYYVVTGHQG